MFAHPSERMGHHLRPAALDSAIAILSWTFVVEARIVEIESAVKARSIRWFRLENDGTDKRRRLITVLAQDLGPYGRSLARGVCMSFSW